MLDSLSFCMFAKLHRGKKERCCSTQVKQHRQLYYYYIITLILRAGEPPLSPGEVIGGGEL